MKILLIGARGTIGSAVYNELKNDHELITAGRKGTDITVDITSLESIVAMYLEVGDVDAVVVTAGDTYFGELEELTPEKNDISIDHKMKGQINVVLVGKDYVKDKGSFTLTTGIIVDDPIIGGISSAMVSGAIRAFVKAVAIELPRGIRINEVSPNALIESFDKYGLFFPGFEPVPGNKVAKAYRKSIEGGQTGQTYKVYK